MGSLAADPVLESYRPLFKCGYLPEATRLLLPRVSSAIQVHKSALGSWGSCLLLCKAVFGKTLHKATSLRSLPLAYALASPATADFSCTVCLMGVNLGATHQLEGSQKV